MILRLFSVRKSVQKMEITPNSNQDRIKNQYEVGEQVQTEAKWKSTAILEDFLFCPISSDGPIRGEHLSGKDKQTIRPPHLTLTNLLDKNQFYHTFWKCSYGRLLSFFFPSYISLMSNRV